MNKRPRKLWKGAERFPQKLTPAGTGGLRMGKRGEADNLQRLRTEYSGGTNYLVIKERIMNPSLGGRSKMEWKMGDVQRWV